jgi:putative transposase
MPTGLERRYGLRQLHFITFSCRRWKPFLTSPRARDLFLTILDEERTRRGFALVGYVVMPEHIHLLISEPLSKAPSSVMMVLKQRSSRRIRAERIVDLKDSFWEPRFYDFNVWSNDQRGEKLNYMHMNPVKRGLVQKPEDWPWSSAYFYRYRQGTICIPDLMEE